MTKEQEIKALEAFIESLPKNTYLYEFFAEELVEISNAIRSDLWYEVSRSMRELRVDRDSIKEEIQRLVIEEKTRQDRVDQLRRDQARMEAALMEIGTKANEISERANRIWSMVR